MTASLILLLLAIGFVLASALAFHEGKVAFRSPIHHDGIGGKDTDNLIAGCMAPFVGIAIGGCALVTFVVAGVVWACGY